MDLKKKKIELLAPRVAAAVSVFLALFKIFMGTRISSVAIVTSGLDSLFDALISGMTFFFLKMSHEPADEDHPYGHSRIATLTSLGQGLLLFVVVFFLTNQAVRKLHEPFYPHLMGQYLVISAIATFVTMALWVYLGFVVKATKSSVVAADRLHYSTDVGANILLFVGFFIGPYFHQYNIDALLALGLCLFIAAGAYNIVVSSINNLVDRQDPHVEENIATVIKSFYPRVLGYQKLRSRKSGHLSAVDVELISCRRKNLQESNDLAHEVEAAILETIPHIDILIHPEPCNKSQCPSDQHCVLESQGVKFHKKS